MLLYNALFHPVSTISIKSLDRMLQRAVKCAQALRSSPFNSATLHRGTSRLLSAAALRSQPTACSVVRNNTHSALQGSTLPLAPLSAAGMPVLGQAFARCFSSGRDGGRFPDPETFGRFAKTLMGSPLFQSLIKDPAMLREVLGAALKDPKVQELSKDPQKLAELMRAAYSANPEMAEQLRKSAAGMADMMKGWGGAGMAGDSEQPSRRYEPSRTTSSQAGLDSGRGSDLGGSTSSTSSTSGSSNASSSSSSPSASTAERLTELLSHFRNKARFSSKSKLAAAFSLAACSLASLKDSLGWTVSTPERCAEACDAFIKSVLPPQLASTFRSYHRQGLYTVEFPAPFPHAQPVVLLHGYASGSGLYAFNVEELSQRYKLYLVDWLGCGASERPAFKAKTTAEAEAFFLTSLEAWRKETGLERMNVVGHSLGGYLSAAYALQHHNRVRTLTLVSPAGIPVPPAPELVAGRTDSWVIGLLQTAWENGVTPQAIVRAMGPWGEKWLSDIVTRRFRHMLDGRQRRMRTGSGSSYDNSSSSSSPSLDRAAFVHYLYQITAGQGSGEYALNALLSFGAHARLPMGPRLIAAASQPPGATTVPGPDGEAEAVEEGTVAARGPYRVPTLFLYGESHDWMPIDAGQATADRLRGLGVRSAAMAVPDSGHHLYMEQPELFCRALDSHIMALAEGD